MTRHRYLLSCACHVPSRYGPRAATTPNVGQQVYCTAKGHEPKMTTVVRWERYRVPTLGWEVV